MTIEDLDKILENIPPCSGVAGMGGEAANLLMLSYELGFKTAIVEVGKFLLTNKDDKKE